jgi:PAS domain S-box-containing protein
MHGHFLEVNDAACKRLEYTKEEFLKLSPQKIDSPRFAKLVPARVKELLHKGHAVFESVHITKKGKEIPVQISSKVIGYDGKLAILSIVRDMSFKK